MVEITLLLTEKMVIILGQWLANDSSDSVTSSAQANGHCAKGFSHLGLTWLDLTFFGHAFLVTHQGLVVLLQALSELAQQPSGLALDGRAFLVDKQKPSTTTAAQFSWLSESTTKNLDTSWAFHGSLVFQFSALRRLCWSPCRSSSTANDQPAFSVGRGQISCDLALDVRSCPMD